MQVSLIEAISNFIFLEDEIRPCDVIFLPGSTFAEQPEMASKLYREGMAKLLVPSGDSSFKVGTWQGVSSGGEKYQKVYRNEADFFSSVMKENGVPSSAILEEPLAKYTKQNAVFTKELLREREIEVKSAILVCRAFHARRALMYYQLSFPEVSFLICPVHTIGITKENWFKTEEGIELVMGELSKCGSQLFQDVKSFYLKG